MKEYISKYPTEAEIPEEYKLPRIDCRILIDGKIIEAGFERNEVHAAFSVRQNNNELIPYLLGTTPHVSQQVMLDAIEAASKAWNKGTGQWPTARMDYRINAVGNFRNEMLKQRDAIAKLLMLEIGKNKKDSYAEFDRTIQYIDDTLDATKTLDRDNARLQFSGGIIAQIRRAPLGVTLCMGPYNYPLNETFTTLIPALIMGNTAVVKMARFGRLFWDFLLPAFARCFPAGVVNVINGDGKVIIGDAMKSGKIDILAFIGSSVVADKIKTQHPHPHRLRSILGLDAKNPAIILPEADLDIAVDECIRGALSFNGQRCTAIKVIFAHKSIVDAFSQKLSKVVSALKVGMPWEDGVQITPLPDVNKPKDLRAMLDDSLDKGAKLLNAPLGGQFMGNLFFPAVVGNVSLNSRLGNEEQFGPIIPVVTFDNLSEVEEYVVSSHYGQQASIFGKDPSIIGRLIDTLANQICRININVQCQRGPDVYPFTGRKASAEGTLSVSDALRAFSIRSMVAAKQDVQGKAVVKAILDSDTSAFLSTDILL